MTVLAIDKRNNARMIADVAALGWFDGDPLVLDATFGLGRFWTEYRPARLIGSDLNPDKASHLVSSYFDLPFADHSVDVVVFDPPYRYRGTASLGEMDRRYGTEESGVRWQDVEHDIITGAMECARVARRAVMVKCQAQVVSGKKRWQDRVVADAVEVMGWRLADRLDNLGGRAQPPGRRQVHARQNLSTFLLFKRE